MSGGSAEFFYYLELILASLLNCNLRQLSSHVTLFYDSAPAVISNLASGANSIYLSIWITYVCPLYDKSSRVVSLYGAGVLTDFKQLEESKNFRVKPSTNGP